MNLQMNYMNNKVCTLLAIAALSITACKGPQKEDKPIVFIDPLLENRDTTLNPGDDFFKYACGTWMKKNPIPETEKSWGIWSMVQEETYNRMRLVSEAAAKAKSSNGSNQQKIGDFYFSGMEHCIRRMV